MSDPSFVIVPRSNVNDDQAVIAAWLVAPGEYVAVEQPIATLETTKATFDVHADRAGYVWYDHEVNSIVAVGSVLARISEAPASRRSAAEVPSTAEDNGGAAGPRVTRKAQHRMQELGVRPDELPADGRIEVADVERIAAARMATRHMTPSEHWEPLEQSTSKIMEAARLGAVTRAVVPSLVVVPVSCERLEARLRSLREQAGPVSVLELVIREAAALLPRFPDLNGFVADGRAWTYRDVAVGFAVNVEGSLKVPVVRRASQLSQFEVSRAVRSLMMRAFRGETSVDDVAGGTFTVTDLSAHGVTHCVPVLNDRQSAILAVCAPPPASAWQELVLAFDHRISDGVRAGTFLAALSKRLES